MKTKQHKRNAPKTKQVAIDADLHRRLKKLADANTRTIGKQLTHMLRAQLEEVL